MGCSTAYKMIYSLGLGNFYKYLEEQISRNSLNQQNNKQLEEIDMTEFVTKEDGGNFVLNLLVEGLHCSSCVWLIEEALKKQENIDYVRLNMSTRRLVIKWSGDKEHGNEYTNLIHKMGYKATAFDPETLKTEDNKEQSSLLLAMAIAGFASGNIMLMSVALWSTSQEIMGVATRDFIHLVSAIIALPAVIFSGKIFFKSALIAIRNKRTNMDVPISIAIILTTLVSIWEWFNSAEHAYFDSVTMLVFFLLVQVNVGDKIPVDGEIIEGITEVDTSIITGESLPKISSIGHEVFAGTINLGMTIKVKVTKASEKSLISEVIKLMEKAEDSATKYNSISEKAVRIYSPLVYFAGTTTFLYWYFSSGLEFRDSLIIAISVLIITCPCAFGLAVPTVQVLSSGKLFKNGIMLKNGNALEALSNITYAIFDKTGNITLGKPKLTNKADIKVKYLQLASSMAVKSNHPYSKALVAEYNGKFLEMEVTEKSGIGLSSEFNNNKYQLEKSSKGVSLKENGQELAVFKFSDKIREDAKDIISELKNIGIKSKLVSGDNKKEVEKIAKLAGMNDYKFDYLPQQKVEEVESLKKLGEVILMVGDGLNDAPALTYADVSISPATAIDITQNSADIVFQGDKLKPILTCIILAKKSTAIIKQNFAIAFVYNFIAIPIAFMGYVTPLVAAAAMSFSSILVVLNSFRVR